MSKRIVAAMAIVCGLTGCASVFNGTTQAVTIRSAPEGATVAVTNRAGVKIHTGTTPVTLTLKRGAGYFKSETYKVALTKEGFADKELTIDGTLSGWYIGNIMLGGALGMLIIDPATGGMYTFPDSVMGTLDGQVQKTSSADGALTIVSSDSLTPAQRALMRPISSGN